MTYATLKIARSSIANFDTDDTCVTPALRAQHNHVQLPSGRWCNTFGTPGADNTLRVVHTRGNLWRMERV